MLNSQSRGRPLAVAHRGASGPERENTVSAFRAARRLGADMVELDVRRTGDGVLVVHHDAEIPGFGPIVGRRADELPDWVPTLAEALEACEGMLVDVEVKHQHGEPDFDAAQPAARAVAEVVAGTGRDDQVLVSSFDLASVDAVRAVDPTIPTGLLTIDTADPARVLATALRHGHRTFLPLHWAVTPELVGAAHADGVAVVPWTVDDPDRMRALADMGVDAIVTNRVDVLLDVLDVGR